MGWVKSKSFVQNRVLAFIVLFLSVSFFALSLHASLGIRQASHSASKIPPPNPAPEQGRILASVEFEGPRSSSKFGTAKVEKIKLGCLDSEFSGTEIDSEADFVRLSGRICQVSKAGKVNRVDAKIAERNTPLMGFYQNHSEIFSTDFFPLESGVNTIEVSISMANGETRQARLRLIKDKHSQK